MNQFSKRRSVRVRKSSQSPALHLAVSGTPGTGKTTLAKRISKLFDIQYISLIDLILANKLQERYDRRAKTYDVSVPKVERFLQKNLDRSDSYVIDSHLGQLLPKEIVDSVAVTTCKLSVLDKRLRRRRYSAQKRRDNLDAEIFQVCYTESINNKKKTITIDCTKKMSDVALKARLRPLLRRR